MQNLKLPDLASIIRNISTKSILNPLLYLTCIVIVAALIAGYLKIELANALGDASLACIAFTVIAYIFWSFRAPSRLQSETHIEELKKLELMLDDRLATARPPMIDVTPTTNHHIE